MKRYKCNWSFWIGVAILAALIIVAIIAPAPAKGSEWSIDQAALGTPKRYVGTTFMGYVLTDLGTFAIYYTDYETINRRWHTIKPTTRMNVTAFSDRYEMEIWYTEDAKDRWLGRFSWYETPLEYELNNIRDEKTWEQALDQDVIWENEKKREITDNWVDKQPSLW